MPIDTSMYSQLRPARTADPLQTAGRMIALRNMIDKGRYTRDLREQQAEQRRLQNEQARQEAEDRRVIQDAWGQTGGDLDKLLEATRGKIGPQQQQQLESWVVGLRERVGKLKKEEKDTLRTTAEAVGSAYQWLVSMPDEESRAAAWGDTVRALEQQGHLKPGDAPAEYPGLGTIQAYVAPLIGAQKWIENEWAAAAHALDMETRGTTLAGKLLGAARSQAEWDLALKRLPPNLRASYPAMYSPEAAAQAAAQAMTPAERATAERAGWQAVRSTDEHGNVWEWRVNPSTGESTEPANKGKIGSGGPSITERRLADQEERRRNVERWASQFLNQAEGDITEAKALLEEAAKADEVDDFVRTNRISIQQSLAALERGRGEDDDPSDPKKIVKKAIGKLDAGQTSGGKEPAAPRSTDTVHAAPAGNTATMAQVRRFALINGITIAQARRDFEGAGYTIQEK